MSKKIQKLLGQWVGRLKTLFSSKTPLEKGRPSHFAHFWKKIPPPKELLQSLRPLLNWKVWQQAFLSLRGKTQGKSFREIFLAIITSKNGEWLVDKTKRFLEVLFRPQSRPRVHHVFVWCFFIVCSYCVGKVCAYLLSPVEETVTIRAIVFPASNPLTMDQVQQISQNNFFKSKAGLENSGLPSQRAVIDERIPCLEATKTTSLPLTITNAIVLQDSEKSLVAIRFGGEADTKTYREGEKISNVAKIGRVEGPNAKVIFKNLKTGDCEYIELANDDSDGRLKIVSAETGRKLMDANKVKGIEMDGNRFLISRNVLDEKMADLQTILTEARAIPITNPDGSLSFKITEIEPGSIYAVLGIENEDKITHINGKPIQGLNQIMEMFSNIRDIDDLQLQVEKENGEDATLNYHLTQ